MSAAGRTLGARSANDEYWTPPWCVERLMERVAQTLLFRSHPLRWLEPCAGSGSVIRAARAFLVAPDAVSWDAVELDEKHEDALFGLAKRVVIGNFLEVVPAHYDAVITNPPYALAEEFVRACIPVADHVIMLMRLNWIADHGDLVNELRPDVLVLPDRPSFCLNKHGKVGSDATEYAWYWFHPERRGQVSVLAKTPKEVRSAYRRELYARLAAEKEDTACP